MNVKVDGEKLRSIREELLIEREDVHALTGIAQPTITQIELGKRNAIRLSTAKRLAEALGVEMSEFSSGEVVRNKPRKSSVVD